MEHQPEHEAVLCENKSTWHLHRWIVFNRRQDIEFRGYFLNYAVCKQIMDNTLISWSFLAKLHCQEGNCQSQLNNSFIFEQNQYFKTKKSWSITNFLWKYNGKTSPGNYPPIKMKPVFSLSTHLCKLSVFDVNKDYGNERYWHWHNSELHQAHS